jgi:hypothetical protein
MPTKRVLFALFACASAVLAQTGGFLTGLEGFARPFAACQKEQTGKVCGFFGDKGKVSGTCEEVKVSDAKLVCKRCYMNC